MMRITMMTKTLNIRRENESSVPSPFHEDLYKKPQILVANKIDHPEAEAKFAGYRERLEAINPTLMACSSVTGMGIKELVYKIKELLDTAREEKE